MAGELRISGQTTIIIGIEDAAASLHKKAVDGAIEMIDYCGMPAVATSKRKSKTTSNRKTDDQENLSDGRIDSLRRRTRTRYKDLNLIEKVIRALSLLEMLKLAECPFCFKGGSALMLILGESAHRLSIDINIIKQLYDVGRLFDHSREFRHTAETFMQIGRIELLYRNLPAALSLIHQDIRETALCIVHKRGDGPG